VGNVKKRKKGGGEDVLGGKEWAILDCHKKKDRKKVVDHKMKRKKRAQGTRRVGGEIVKGGGGRTSRNYHKKGRLFTKKAYFLSERKNRVTSGKGTHWEKAAWSKVPRMM